MGYNLKEIEQQISIEELAEEYDVDLEPAGNDYIALCPFHDDVRTKSLRIYPMTSSWWCYGCQRGGSVFDFVMLAEGISFAEAVDNLAKKCGLHNSFDLSGIETQSSCSFSQFKELRENIESRITLQLREFYFSKKSVWLSHEKDVYYNYMNDLWNWFDKSQRFFDKYLLYREKCLRNSKEFNEEALFQYLTNKLHSFYLKFVEKFNYVKERINNGQTTQV